MKRSNYWSLLWFLAFFVISGCQPSTSTTDQDQEVLTHRVRLTLAQEPSGAVGILDLRESLIENGGEAAVESPDSLPAKIALVGRIGGKATAADREHSDFPWEKGMAAFAMSDPSATIDHEHDHGDDHHDCPFCNKKAADPRATVQFKGDDGKTLNIDARDLFELKGEELVVVRGTAQLVGSVLMVTADGIYVRR